MDIALVLHLDSGDALADLEQRAIEAALTACGGNISATARRLGVHRSTLQRKIRGWRQAAIFG